MVKILQAVLVLITGLAPGFSTAQTETQQPAKFLLDLVYSNPGESPPWSAFIDPARLKDWGYTGQVVANLVEGVSTFDALDPKLVPAGSKEREWADARTRSLAAQIKAAHDAGQKCYAWMQVLVLPKSVIARYRNEITDSRGRIDVALPRTQELLRTQIAEIFRRLPDLDGLVIRTGEIYLQDLPYHAATASGSGDKIQGSTAILNGPQSHIDILKILREEVAGKACRTVFYRTWDFGNFHVKPDYYLRVTDAIEPHPNLLFSVKHQAGDFHQLTPFNPTLSIGKHRQIIEVQCQREAYGKGAHPYYIGQGVIEGWEEYAWMMPPGRPQGLRDIIKTPQFAGVWTWSRGGGWDGPYIDNEFWCALNAYVIAQFAQNPARTEGDIFAEFEHKLGLNAEDVERFRRLATLSTKAVLRGQLTTLGADIDVWWARDDTLGAPNLDDFIKKDLVEKAIEEKRQAVELWREIETISRQIRFADASTQRFVETSATYGRIKYDVIAQGWTVLLLGRQGDTGGTYDRPRIKAAITAYDRSWEEWKQLKAAHPECATLHNDRARGGKPAFGAAVEKYRLLVR